MVCPTGMVDFWDNHRPAAQGNFPKELALLLPGGSAPPQHKGAFWIVQADRDAVRALKCAVVPRSRPRGRRCLIKRTAHNRRERAGLSKRSAARSLLLTCFTSPCDLGLPILSFFVHTLFYHAGRREGEIRTLEWLALAHRLRSKGITIWSKTNG